LGRKCPHQVTNIDAVNKQNDSYRTHNWRYIRYSDGQEKLYDHRNDPYEWHNLVKEPSQVIIKKQLIKEMIDIIGKELE
jgi:arylsulfatase A-like enzyme